MQSDTAQQVVTLLQAAGALTPEVVDMCSGRGNRRMGICYRLS